MGSTLIFHHIPKTAGTTVRKFFQSRMSDQQEFIHLTAKGVKIAHAQGLLPFDQRSLDERNQAKIIFGHDVNIKTADLITNPHEFAVCLLLCRSEPQQWCTEQLG